MLVERAVRRLELSPEQRRSLEKIAGRRSGRAGDARRARVILLSADGLSGREIAKRVGISAVHVSRIRKRFWERGLEGLHERRKAGRKDNAVTTEMIEDRKSGV
jgi:transposase